MAHRISHAAFALNFPDGRWARAEALLSAMTCSTTADLGVDYGMGGARSGALTRSGAKTWRTSGSKNSSGSVG